MLNFNENLQKARKSYEDGEYDKALTWYSNVITTVGANYKFKEMARNGRDMIKEMKLQKNA